MTIGIYTPCTMAIFGLLLFTMLMVSTNAQDDGECIDHPKKFKFGKKKKSKKCKGWAKFCVKTKKVIRLCPVTCGTCPTNECIDEVDNIPTFKSGTKNCKWINSRKENTKKKFCKKKSVKEHCPKTCEICKLTSPTQTPSASPSMAPSLIPSSFPSMFPSMSPSLSPTMTCTLTGVMSFPTLEEAEYYGYHRDTLQVSKTGKKIICGTDNKKTWWGCVHKGTAKIENFEYYASTSQSESVTIENVNGNSYRFKIQHKFSSEETYYDKDYKMVGELIIAANDVVLGSFSRPSDVDTHDGSTVNAAYEDVMYVNVDCTRQCECSATDVLPTCKVRGEIGFPSVENAYYGYHNDFIVARKEGSEDTCSYDGSTNWCTHDGDALVYKFKDEPTYSESEAVVIPEAAGEKYSFKIEHYFSSLELYYDNDHMMPGTFTVWINGQDKGSYTRDVIKNISTHDADGNINPKYKSAFYVDVECDESCDCTLSRRDNVECEIKGLVKFPKQKDAPYYGHHSSSVTVEKIGEEEICEKSNVGRTGWNCKHDGGTAQISNWKEGDGEFSRDSESALIRKGEGGNFRFSLQHNFNDLENNDAYPEDHKMVGNMTISINGNEMGTFSHPKNNKTDTHLQNGNVNPNYKGLIYVDVECDTECNCDVNKHRPLCEIDAMLSFNEFEDDTHGYHSNYLIVTKDGTSEECGWSNTMTSWGCIHKGDAYILDYVDDKYYDNNGTESVYIPDAANGMHNFTVNHYYTYYETYYDEDHKNPAELNIMINGETYGPFSHPKNENEDTHNEDGTVNENYDGTVSVSVECTDKCDCDVTVI